MNIAEMMAVTPGLKAKLAKAQPGAAVGIGPLRFSDMFCRAAIATGAIVPPPGGPGRPLGAIAAWVTAGAILAGMALLGFLWGLGTR